MWDVLSNDEAVQIVAGTPDREKAAKRLVECKYSQKLFTDWSHAVQCTVYTIDCRITQAPFGMWGIHSISTG